jgi:uncharacterized iron-regulated membrane protein
MGWVKFIVVVVGLVILFRDTIKTVVEDTLENVQNKSDSVDNFGE